MKQRIIVKRAGGFYDSLEDRFPADGFFWSIARGGVLTITRQGRLNPDRAYAPGQWLTVRTEEVSDGD